MRHGLLREGRASQLHRSRRRVEVVSASCSSSPSPRRRAALRLGDGRRKGDRIDRSRETPNPLSRDMTFGYTSSMYIYTSKYDIRSLSLVRFCILSVSQGSCCIVSKIHTIRGRSWSTCSFNKRGKRGGQHECAGARVCCFRPHQKRDATGNILENRYGTGKRKKVGGQVNE